MRIGLPLWGFLLDRIDYRIAVSAPARDTIAAWIPGEWEIIPNGTLIPDEADPGRREHSVLFIGRHEPRKGLHVLLRAWPGIHARTGAVLRIIGADPLAVRLVISRVGIDAAGIEVAGFLSQEELTRELLSAKALVAPSLGGESFGMVLTRAFACATPVVASDIGGYREVIEPGTAVLAPPRDVGALTDAVVSLLGDEQRRHDIGTAARRLAIERYSWDRIASRLAEIYEQVLAS
jgi:phosphatidylinositol alpha-mannosyltransferase